jgi:cysteine-rich repeat protein
MSARRVAPLGIALAVAVGGAAAACSGSDDDRPAPHGQQSATGGSSAAATGPSQAGSSDDAAAGDGAIGTGAAGNVGGESTRGGTGTAGEAASGGTLATGGGTGSAQAAGTAGQLAVCGDGVAEGDEPCDAEQFAAGVDCQSFGFDEGTLRCNDDCTVNTEACSGTERCYDGHDNDGDTLVDCLDDEDCSAACSDPCSDVPVLADPGSVHGSTAGSVDLSAASCSASPSGPELAYELTVATTGMLDVELSSFRLLTVSLRTRCADAASELGCDASRLSVPVAAGDTLYAVVEGLSDVDAGEFNLRAASRPATVCGDGFLDPEEECEDENTDPGDGCSADCMLESTETEPNDTPGEADALRDPYYGQIDPAGDVDVIAVEVAAGPASLRVSTHNVGIGMCGLELMDSYLEILDSNGTTMLSSDDDGGDGFCACASTFALPAGTYYVRVEASEYAAPSLDTFPYRLGVSLDLCGNGMVAAGEECDDGNTESFDGCSAVCRVEPSL